MKRAGFSLLGGGIGPGGLSLEPGLAKNREDWPFPWGDNEPVISPAATCVFPVNAARDLFK